MLPDNLQHNTPAVPVRSVLSALVAQDVRTYPAPRGFTKQADTGALHGGTVQIPTRVADFQLNLDMA